MKSAPRLSKYKPDQSRPASRTGVFGRSYWPAVVKAVGATEAAVAGDGCAALLDCNEIAVCATAATAAVFRTPTVGVSVGRVRQRSTKGKGDKPNPSHDMPPFNYP